MSRQQEIPTVEVGALREYLGALTYARQAIRHRERELLDRCELVAFREAREARRQLEELRELVDRAGGS